jgi:signal transduction histidine kinase
LIRPIAERKGITVTQDLAPAYAVRADRMRLKQVLLNLMSNGIKYPNPRIELRQCSKSLRISLSSLIAGRHGSCIAEAGPKNRSSAPV